MNRLARHAPIRWALYAFSLVLQLGFDISVSVGAWWAMVQQHEAGWRRKKT